MPPLLADFTHARPCKPFCEKYLTLPGALSPQEPEKDKKEGRKKKAKKSK